jgi:Resolvase, N terminal domain
LTASKSRGRDLRHLVNTVHNLTARRIGFKVLTGRGASIDTTFPGGELVFGIFAALAEFERELIIERTKAGMATARTRHGGRPYKMAPSKLSMAVASMNQPETRIGDLCAEFGITLRMRRSITRRSHRSTLRGCRRTSFARRRMAPSAHERVPQRHLPALTEHLRSAP